jgi:hypothetical protein
MPDPTDFGNVSSEDLANPPTLIDRILSDYLAQMLPEVGPDLPIAVLRHFADYADGWIATHVAAIGEGFYGAQIRLDDGTPVLMTGRAMPGADSELPPEPPTIQLANADGRGVPAFPKTRGAARKQEPPTIQLAQSGPRRPAG